MPPKDPTDIYYRSNTTSASSSPDASHHNNSHHDKSRTMPHHNKRRPSHRTAGLVVALLLFLTLWSSLGDNKNKSHQSSTSQQELRDTTVGPAVPRHAMAACLLLFDDNLSLVEWLAYHYHTLPLRHVIVLTDPRSTESPLAILERYTANASLGLSFEYWDEGRVFPDPHEWQQLKQAGDLVKLHRARQGYFYGQCMRELKLRSQQQQEQQADHQEKDQWVLLTDVDEYVTLNPRLALPQHKLYQKGVNITMAPPGRILNFLTHESSHPPPCLHMARRDMVSKESSAQEMALGVPNYMDPTSLFTTRWRYMSHRTITGKCLVNLAQLQYQDLPLQTPKQGHIALEHFQCPQLRPKWFYTMENTRLAVHHYLGTKDQYQHRDDPRRDRTTTGFDQKQKQPTTLQDNARTWLQGFIDSVGKEQALKLLAGAGVAQPEDSSSSARA